MYIGLQVQFEQNQYVVSESVGVLPICIRLTGGVQRQLTLMFSTQDGSATGKNTWNDNESMHLQTLWQGLYNPN